MFRPLGTTVAHDENKTCGRPWRNFSQEVVGDNGKRLTGQPSQAEFGLKGFRLRNEPRLGGDLQSLAAYSRIIKQDEVSLPSPALQLSHSKSTLNSVDDKIYLPSRCP